MNELPEELLFLIGLELSLSDLAALRCTSSHYNRVFSDSCYWKRRAKMYLNVCSAPNVAWHDDPIGFDNCVQQMIIFCEVILPYVNN